MKWYVLAPLCLVLLAACGSVAGAPNELWQQSRCIEQFRCKPVIAEKADKIYAGDGALESERGETWCAVVESNGQLDSGFVTRRNGRWTYFIGLKRDFVDFGCTEAAKQAPL